MNLPTLLALRAAYADPRPAWLARKSARSEQGRRVGAYVRVWQRRAGQRQRSYCQGRAKISPPRAIFDVQPQESPHVLPQLSPEQVTMHVDPPQVTPLHVPVVQLQV